MTAVWIETFINVDIATVATVSSFAAGVRPKEVYTCGRRNGATIKLFALVDIRFTELAGDSTATYTHDAGRSTDTLRSIATRIKGAFDVKLTYVASVSNRTLASVTNTKATVYARFISATTNSCRHLVAVVTCPSVDTLALVATRCVYTYVAAIDTPVAATRLTFIDVILT